MKPIDTILDVSRFTPAAHRGAPFVYPENTMESFARAREILPGCLLETDVRRTADCHVVLRHDPLLETTTDGKGTPGSFSLDEVKSLDAGYNITFDGGAHFPFRGRGFRIATLEEALEGFPDALFSIDIKENSRVFADCVIDIIRRHQAEGRVIVGSFHGGVTAHMRHKHPDIVRHAGFGDVIGFILRSGFSLAGGFRPRDHAFFVPEFQFGRLPEYRGAWSGLRIVTKRFIEAAHMKGMPVFAWTINDKENMRRLIEWGVNGIVTDFPDRLKEVMGEMDRQLSPAPGLLSGIRR